jgi:phage repressor protein C with HTH and peptisase S24 domain
MDIAQIRRDNARDLSNKCHGISAFAEKLGKSQSQISSMIGTNPTKNIGNKIAREIETAFGLPHGWMDVCHEPSSTKIEEEIGSPIHAWDNLSELDPEHYVGVPRYDVHVSAGNGAVVYEAPEKEKPQSFRIEWLNQHGWKGKNLICIKAAGDSMIPTIADGADLLVNQADTTIRDGRVYVIRFGNEVRVKRLYLRPDGGIVVHSDNPVFERIEVPADQMQHIAIIGRVVWQAGML